MTSFSPDHVWPSRDLALLEQAYKEKDARRRSAALNSLKKATGRSFNAIYSKACRLGLTTGRAGLRRSDVAAGLGVTEDQVANWVTQGLLRTSGSAELLTAASVKAMLRRPVSPDGLDPEKIHAGWLLSLTRGSNT